MARSSKVVNPRMAVLSDAVAPANDNKPARSRADASEVLAVLDQHDMELTVDTDGRAFVSFGGPRFNRWPVRSADAEGEIRRLFRPARRWRTTEGEIRDVPISRTVMGTVIDSLDAWAHAEQRQPHPVRVAACRSATWIDLGQPGWSAVRVGRRGWEVRDGREVPFSRPSGMQPMPRPVRHPAALQRLRALLAGLDDFDFHAVLFFMLASLRARGPFPIGVLHGGEGARKTSVARILRAILDPHALEVSSLPERLRDGVTQGAQLRLLVYDNLSEISPEFADTLCQRCEGATAGFRTNYSDRDLTIVRSYGPTLLTGIVAMVGRADLASRCLFLPVTPPAAGAYRPLEEVEAELDAIRPGVLAVLLDAMVIAEDRIAAGQVPGSSASRLASFERLARAAAPAFGLSPAAVDRVLERQQELRRRAISDNDAVAAALLDFLSREARQDGLMQPPGRIAWKGSRTELLARLNEVTPTGRFLPDWPKTGSAIGQHLKRLEVMLQAMGIDVRHRHAGRQSDKLATTWSWLEISAPSGVLARGADPVDPAGADSLH